MEATGWRVCLAVPSRDSGVQVRDLSLPASSVLVLQQSKLPAVFHQYFGGGFVISEFQDWHEFWSIVGSNPDMTRGMTQLQYTAPFYAGIAYSIAAWIGRRTSLTQTVVEKVKRWEQTRFKHQQ
jgi:hypothetical protein